MGDKVVGLNPPLRSAVTWYRIAEKPIIPLIFTVQKVFRIAENAYQLHFTSLDAREENPYPPHPISPNPHPREA